VTTMFHVIDHQHALWPPGHKACWWSITWNMVVTRHAGGQLRETWWSQGMLVVNYVKHGRHKACWWSITYIASQSSVYNMVVTRHVGGQLPI
jgi:hypothetical protein